MRKTYVVVCSFRIFDAISRFFVGKWKNVNFRFVVRRLVEKKMRRVYGTPEILSEKEPGKKRISIYILELLLALIFVFAYTKLNS